LEVSSISFKTRCGLLTKPYYGLAFEKIELTHWMQNILYALRTDPGLYVPEIVGAMILVAFVAMLVRRKRVYPFIKNGQVL